MSKIVYVTVKLELAEDADWEDVVTNMDYSFDYEGIEDTEITEVDFIG